MMCLGLVPTLGGPDEPLHWLMTAAMTGFGVLLLARHRLQQREPELAEVSPTAARHAGRAVLWITGISAVLVLGIVARQGLQGGPIGALSLIMPLVALVWLGSLGLKALRARSESAEAATLERPSRLPQWERLSSPPPSAPPAGPSSHVSA